MRRFGAGGCEGRSALHTRYITVTSPLHQVAARADLRRTLEVEESALAAAEAANAPGGGAEGGGSTGGDAEPDGDQKKRKKKKGGPPSKAMQACARRTSCRRSVRYLFQTVTGRLCSGSPLHHRYITVTYLFQTVTGRLCSAAGM